MEEGHCPNQAKCCCNASHYIPSISHEAAPDFLCPRHFQSSHFARDLEAHPAATVSRKLFELSPVPPSLLPVWASFLS